MKLRELTKTKHSGNKFARVMKRKLRKFPEDEEMASKGKSYMGGKVGISVSGIDPRTGGQQYHGKSTGQFYNSTGTLG